MNERSKELLSAHLDGDLTEEEAIELADYWANEPALRAVGRRYQLVGEVLRTRNDTTEPDFCLVQRLRQQIDRPPESDQGAPINGPLPIDCAKEPRPPVFLQPDVKSDPRWRKAVKPAAAFLLAAGIAALAVGSVRIWNAGNGASESALTTASAKVRAASSRSGNWNGAEPTVEHKLNTYLANHSEVSGAGNLPAYVRKVSHSGEGGHSSGPAANGRQ
ncbi:MAG: hypothetical protein GKR94_14740 [Gammaproteobacteria bacterium]|nr:hypothetical protein [Gammaproteobacteria bacterium]